MFCEWKDPSFSYAEQLENAGRIVKAESEAPVRSYSDQFAKVRTIVAEYTPVSYEQVLADKGG